MLGAEADLFKRLQRGSLDKLSLTPLTCDKVVGIPYRHSGPKVEAHTPMITGGAGNLLESEGDIRLCANIELHVRVDRKRVKALLADASPVAVSPHESFINSKARLLADGTGDGVQPLFHFLLSQRDHLYSIAGEEKKSQLWASE